MTKLVFLDESGVNTGMTKLYGRAWKGNRVVDYVPDVRFHTTSIFSSVRLNGATIQYLPPYSPDLNPIEMMWSKMKNYLRKEKARSADVLFGAIGDALNLVSPSDILGWFHHTGYSV